MKKNDHRIITPEMLEHLPEPVQHYLTCTGVVGYPWIENVRLKQIGKFRQGPDQPWMPLTAQEFYTTDPPSLLWNARFKIAGLPLVRARDRYQGGHGHMFGKLAGLFTVFDVCGEQLDQATMIRYLNEIMWFPTAYLGDNILWEAQDDASARVTFPRPLVHAHNRLRRVRWTEPACARAGCLEPSFWRPALCGPGDHRGRIQRPRLTFLSMQSLRAIHF